MTRSDGEMPGEEEGLAARCEALALSAQQLAGAGRIVEAERRVAEIPRPQGYSRWAFQRAVAFGAIGSKLLEAGARSRALQVLADARRACEDMQDGAVWEAAYAFAWIAHLFAQSGARREAIADWIRAADLAQANQDLAFMCVVVLEHAAHGLADSGETTQATEVARRIIVEDIRQRVLASVGPSSWTGLPLASIWPRSASQRSAAPQREPTVSMIEPGAEVESEAYEALAVDAQELARTGRLDEALQIVGQLPSPRGHSGWAHEKTVALTTIVSKLLDMGDVVRAVEVLAEARRACAALQDRAIWQAADCLAEIARLLDRMGSRDEGLEAWESAARLAEARGQWEILAEIVRDLAKRGEEPRATELARQIGYDQLRDGTLWYLTVRARGGSPPETTWLLGDQR
jgi:tetratricopeptide (TPR) repeat protein